MKRAVFLLLLAACSNRDLGDYPSRPGGGGPVTQGPGGGSGDGGVGDAANGDAGVLITGRVCIVTDLRTPTVCDGRPAADASKVSVVLGTRTPTAAPTKGGDFTIFAQLGTELVWHASGNGFITTAMPFGTDNIVPIVSDVVYQELIDLNGLAFAVEGQGSVVVRAVNGVASAPGVNATTTLTSANTIPLYDDAASDTDWRVLGPTRGAGMLWFPGVDVTTTPASITLTPPAPGTPVLVRVSVEENAITFVTQDIH